MSPRRWQERIQDILDAIAEIRLFTAGYEFQDFQNDLKTMSAIELDFIVIGEAANVIPDEVQEAYPAIPWQLMRGMRNRLVHTYFGVTPKILWDTIYVDLPSVEKALGEILLD